jgi:acetylglutamate kinase
MPRKPEQPRSVLGELDDSLKSAVWLIAADAAAVQIARKLAADLDSATDVRDVVQLSKALTDCLQALGMNVAGRTGKAEAPREVNPLDHIKRIGVGAAKVAQPTAKAAKPKPAGKRVSKRA